MQELGRDHQLVLGVLATQGLASSADLQAATGKSQPTISRLLNDLSPQVLTLGRARARRYGLPKSIHGFSAQQPLVWTDEEGKREAFGTLTFLQRDLIHIDAAKKQFVSAGSAGLPWFLSPLRLEGFLGRIAAKRLSGQGIDSDLQRWNIETMLFAAIHLQDGTGAISLGDLPTVRAHGQLPLRAKLGAALDFHAADIAATLPAGSSAAGEQPKFLAQFEDGRHVLVKFTPPLDTPFGKRWSDLLHAEALAGTVLGENEISVARTSIVQSETRTYLLSEQFDRVGPHGRRHVVSVGAAHDGFIADTYRNWGATAAALTLQRRLPEADAERAAWLLQFGRLIGNTDMHSGNLSLFVRREDLFKGHFTLAPVYDMLPMRWKPDAALGGAADYSAFEPDAAATSGPASAAASSFWTRLAELDRVSRPLRLVAKRMADRVMQ